MCVNENKGASTGILSRIQKKHQCLCVFHVKFVLIGAYALFMMLFIEHKLLDLLYKRDVYEGLAEIYEPTSAVIIIPDMLTFG